MPKALRTPLSTEILNLRLTFRAVDRSLRRFATSLSQLDGKAPGTQRKRHVSPKARAALKLQGRYMGYMRQLKPRQKALVRRIKETKGVRAAIARARRLRGR